MKKIRLKLLLVFLLATTLNCVGQVKGDEAKQMLSDKVLPIVLTLDSMLYSQLAQLPPDPIVDAAKNGMMVQTMLDALSVELANIDENKYYLKSDIDACGDTIILMDILIVSAWLAAPLCGLSPA